MRSPDEVRRDLVCQWLAKAEQDFVGAEHLLRTKPSLRDMIAFHAQQAAEKALKAFLVQHEVEFPKTHDIRRLLNLAATVDPSLADSLAATAKLGRYGVAVRYPQDLVEISLADAEQAVALACQAFQAIQGLLLDEPNAP